MELSVVIPHYDNYEGLERILLQIYNTKEDLEIIVVDDNSDNSIIQRIEKLREKVNFIFVKNEENLGAGHSRNVAMKYITKKWVIFCDSDDILVENWNEILKKYLETNYEIVFFKPSSIFEDTKKIANRHQYFENLVKEFCSKTGNKEKIRYEFGVPWSKLIKTELIFRNNIIFQETKTINDRLFSTKIGHYAKEVYAVEETYYIATRRKGSLTTLIREDIFDEKIYVMIEITKFLESVGKEKYKPRMLTFLIQSFKYDKFKFIELSKIIKKNRMRIFPLDMIRYTLNGYYLNKIRERYYDRSYNINLNTK